MNTVCFLDSPPTPPPGPTLFGRKGEDSYETGKLEQWELGTRAAGFRDRIRRRGQGWGSPRGNDAWVSIITLST